MIRVAVVARSPVVRARLSRLIEDGGRFGLGAVLDGPEGLADIDGAGREILPADVVVADLDEASAFAWEAACAAEDLPPLVALMHGEPAARVASHLELRGGALLSPGASLSALCAAVEAAAVGLLSIETGTFVTGARLRPESDGDTPGEALTDREWEVLQLLADGHSNKAIARLLGVSEHTAKFHVSSVLSKLDAATRTEAVSVAIRRGLIPL
jgi:DNA-binding NarL/FixJ family response regulator